MAIISLKHKIVFVKTQKTAGTSIEVDLSQFVEPAAIVTPIFPAVQGHIARNFEDENGQALYFNHMPASQIKELLGPQRFAEMTCFCVEREPVDKCISHFHMLRNSPDHNADGSFRLTWAEYVERGNFPIDVQRYTETTEGTPRLLVDRILRYDQLPTVLPAFLAENGIQGFQLKNRAKSQYSRNRLVSIKDVTADQRTMIYRKFKKSMQLSGIKWHD